MSHNKMTFFFENLERFKPYEIEAAKRIIKLNSVEVKNGVIIINTTLKHQII